MAAQAEPLTVAFPIEHVEQINRVAQAEDRTLSG